MTYYHDMNGEERWRFLSAGATQLFNSHRWKSAFARRYNLTPQTITKWRIDGITPVWACQAVEDAVAAQKLAQLRELLPDTL